MDLPVADAEREADALRLFAEFQMIAPEVYAARYAHTIGASSFADFRYRDAALHDWIHRLHEILVTPGAVARYRLQLLTPAEQAAIADEERDL